MIDKEMMKINLRIDCQPYPLKIRREDEELYREAAKLIDKTLNKYRSEIPDLEPVNYWAMAALELAFNSISMVDRNNTEPYQKLLQELTEELDGYINK